MLVEVIYLLILFAAALVYLLDPLGPLHARIGASFGPLPVGVPWFGALGAVIISLSGAFDHRNDWDPSWQLWHLSRPLLGVSLAIVAWLTFAAGILAVGSSTSPQNVTAPSNLLFYLIAFIAGYREELFRELIKKVADVIIAPGITTARPAIGALNPDTGPVSGGTVVTVSGSGFTGANDVKFGAVPAKFSVNSDVQIVATSPQGRGTVGVTITTSAGSGTGGTFTYT